MSRCSNPELHDLLLPYLDGALGQEDWEKLSRHLKSCEACQDEAKEIRSGLKLAHALCPSTKEVLLFMEGKMDPLDQEGFRRHAETCPRCSPLYAAIQGLPSAASAGATEKVPSWFLREVRKSSPGFLSRLLLFPRPALALAVHASLGFLLLFGGFLFNAGQPPPSALLIPARQIAREKAKPQLSARTESEKMKALRSARFEPQKTKQVVALPPVPSRSIPVEGRIRNGKQNQRAPGKRVARAEFSEVKTNAAPEPKLAPQPKLGLKQDGESSTLLPKSAVTREKTATLAQRKALAFRDQKAPSSPPKEEVAMMEAEKAAPPSTKEGERSFSVAKKAAKQGQLARLEKVVNEEKAASAAAGQPSPANVGASQSTAPPLPQVKAGQAPAPRNEVDEIASEDRRHFENGTVRSSAVKKEAGKATSPGKVAAVGQAGTKKRRALPKLEKYSTRTGNDLSLTMTRGERRTRADKPVLRPAEASLGRQAEAKHDRSPRRGLEVPALPFDPYGFWLMFASIPFFLGAGVSGYRLLAKK